MAGVLEGGSTEGRLGGRENVTAPLPRIKLGLGGGRDLACFVGGGITSSDPALGGTSAGGAGRRRRGTSMGDDCGRSIGGPGAEGPGSAVCFGSRQHVGGAPWGFSTIRGPHRGSGGTSTGMAGDQPWIAEVTLRRPSKHTTVPFPSRRTKAGIVMIPNWRISACPCSPIDSGWGMAAHGMGSKKFWVSQLVLHRETRTTWNNALLVFKRVSPIRFW
jgi:hypothetical protein